MILRSEIQNIESALENAEDYEEFFTEVANILWKKVEDLQEENLDLKEKLESLQNEYKSLNAVHENLLENNADLNAENERLLDLTRSIEL